LHRHACQASLSLSILGGLLLWIAGPFVYRVWIRHQVAFDANCFHILLVAVITNSLWDTSAVVPMSVNGHVRIAVNYAGSAMVSLALAWALIPHLGTVGAALALLATDAWMTGLVLRATLRQVQDSQKDFVAALLTTPFARQVLPATGRV
jgi:O-antigen/teichoic acid export membrane protein